MSLFDLFISILFVKVNAHKNMLCCLEANHVKVSDISKTNEMLFLLDICTKHAQNVLTKQRNDNLIFYFFFNIVFCKNTYLHSCVFSEKPKVKTIGTK